VKGSGRLEVGFRVGMVNYMAGIDAGAEWRLVEVPFTSLAPLGKVPEGTKWSTDAIAWFGVTTPQVPRGEERAAGKVGFEVDDVVFYGRGAGGAAPVASGTTWLIARRLREEEARSARAEALRARAELSALRAQLNPHFLFNVLHSVLGMVRRDPALAEAALEGLGDLLRYALRVHRDGLDLTAVRHEWEFMETYLDLERIRLGDRLLAFLRTDDAALDHEVPTFSLQPLVENAVRHGIAPRAAGGKVSIEARIEGDSLRLEVRNDGNVGGAGSSTGGDGDEGGIGLRVLRDRLDVLYRGEASMTAGPTAAGGYRVILTLPVGARGARGLWDPEADE